MAKCEVERENADDKGGEGWTRERARSPFIVIAVRAARWPDD